ncbi:hypothetical protein HYDPIDRAFT_29032 [Hydnomerulius pinastri MD-312]|uniref:Uncharacterized protein n=1 Tax=Hydnomerulius pinastri MD-312 TaxID=994086 RepID=A0A0C9WER4_9AGAM|nr:hypothetical protein HYDPIDRAFT_29032 [Hydnomerulius pinastri MD-312]
MTDLTDIVDVYKQGGPLVEAIPLVKSRSGSDQVKRVLLTTTEAPHLCPTATAAPPSAPAPPHTLALLNTITPPLALALLNALAPLNIDNDEFEEDEGNNTRRLPQLKRARGPPQGHVDQGRGDRSDGTNDYNHPQEAGHRGQKEHHHECAGRHYSPTCSESSDIDIIDAQPAKHSKTCARDPSSSPAPARYEQYDNDRDASPRPSRHRKHDRPCAPSAGPSRQDTSHGKNAHRHDKKRDDEKYRQERRVRGDRY